MNEWNTISIKEIGKVVTGKTPSKNNPEEWGSAYNFITPSDYGNYHKYADKSLRQLSELGADKHKARILPKGSLLVTCIGSDMGKVVQNRLESFTNQQINAVIPNHKIASHDFLYYFFKNSEVFLKNLGSDGSAVPILNKSTFENIKIKLPLLPEQQAIAGVLSALDDKIDLLQRQNQTLEQMAATLFRQWFIEEAQEDWETFYLEELADIFIGRTPPRKESHWFSDNVSDIKWVSIKDLGENGVFTLRTSEYLPKSTIDHFKIPMIPKDTVILSFKMTVGRVGITYEDMVSNEAIAQFQIKKWISKELLYCFLKHYNFDILGTTSSIVTSINTALIKKIELNLPNIEIINKFNQNVESYFNKIKTNQLQIQTLQSLRDTLLPKLIGGEIRLKGFADAPQA